MFFNIRAAHVVIAAFVIGAATPSLAADTGLLKPGYSVSSSFSGTSIKPDVPSDVHPIDFTFIDPRGPVLRVLDLSKLDGPANGQLTNAPNRPIATAGDIGQIFGIAVERAGKDRAPDIFAAATSLYGLQIVSPDKRGVPQRLVKGAPGARWMPGQFGLDKGGGPGTIWKIDGVTGAIKRFADITTDGKANAGPGLGAITHDPVSNQLFVADLESGLIHRLGMDGSNRGTFDHGTAGRNALNLEPVADAKKRMSIESPDFSIENPATWGYADKRRLVFALVPANGRLYYSVAAGPEIWSVAINGDGSFGSDPRREIEITNAPSANLVTSIVFDGANTIYLAQRGEAVGSYDYSMFAKPQQAAVLRYTWNETEKLWSPAPEETPVGLKPPHRATAGGIALGYGYDANGALDLGQCRQTLWTSGDHLREGEDGTRIDPGGARVVAGLQGNAKLLARSEGGAPRTLSVTMALLSEGKLRQLDVDHAPWQSWFVDKDGAYNDGGTDGHIGSVAIHDLCDPKVEAPAPAPVTPVPQPGFASGLDVPPSGMPPPPFPPPGHVTIKKTCAPGPIGGVIECEISLKNVGPGLLDAPVTFNDATVILAGPGAGGAVTITGETPDGPEWLCTPTPTANFSCTLPPAFLPPGAVRSVDLEIDTGPLALAGNFGFRNCASLGAPWFGIACAEGAADIVVKKTAPASCMPGVDCAFELSVQNIGSLPYAGNLLLTDHMFVGGAGVAAPITSIVPALGCGPDPVALPFSCAAPIVLGPGTTKSFTLTVQMPAAPANYWAQNCFAASAPGVAPPALPPAGPPGLQNAVSCAWVPVGAPAALSNLRIEKTALHAGKCGKSFPGPNIVCDYEVKIHNDGPSDFAGPFQFSETVPAAAVLSSIAAPWACAGGPPAYACAVPAIAIVSGGTATIPASVKIPLAPLEAAGCTMANNVAIMVPAGGTNQNFNAGDDTAVAFADAFMSWLLPDGTTFVTCDPTNIIAKKVAKGDCEKVGANHECEYHVSFTNEGPDPYKGPLKLDEKFAIAPISASFSAPWACMPTGSSYQCSHPIVDMQKGDTIELVVKATVPETGACALTNTASLTFPLAGTRFNKLAGDDSASAAAKIASPRCEKSAIEQRCPDGNPLPRSGKCPQVQETCPDGSAKPKSGSCAAPPVTETPPAVEPCPKGKHLNESGRCITDVFDDNDNDDRPDPCPLGMRRDRRGRCVPVEVPCPKGQYRNDNGRCVVIETPRCPPGTTGTPPNCKEIERPKCPPGMIGTPPNCKRVEVPKCPKGTTGVFPNCRKIDLPPPKCPLGMFGTPPNCKVIQIKCPDGMIGSPPNCRKPPGRKCPPGTFGKFPNCERIKPSPGIFVPGKGQDAPQRSTLSRSSLNKPNLLRGNFARGSDLR